MDLNFKGNWVGNIYQRFETMCQDVDDFVSKDTVKHMQTVGLSVKKLYSGVVEDILPPLVDPVKHAAQVLPLKQFDSFGPYASSVIGIEENSVDTDTQELSTNEVPHEDLTFPDNKNMTEQCLDSNSINEKNCYGTKAMVPVVPIIDDQGRSSQEAELSWSWSSESDASVYENEEGGAVNNVDSDVAVDENIMEERAENMSKASLSIAPADENPKNDTSAKVSQSTLVDDSGLRSSHEEEILCKSFLDEVEGDTNTSNSLQNFEVESSVVYCDRKFESSRNSPPTESHSLSDFEDINCPKKADMICCDSTVVMGCLSEFPSALEFSASFQGLAFDDKEADVSSSSILSLEFDDVHTTIRSDEAFSAAEYSGIKLERYYGFVPYKDSMSSLDTGIEDSSTIDVADPSLETIDLSDKVKLDESWGFISEDNPVNAYSFRARGQRSYKKIIQDAFTSRKRLTKEYKQLGLLYGDIDIDSSFHLQQNALASNSKITPPESKESQTKELCDSEWELL